jgi:hypothetical protein
MTAEVLIYVGGAYQLVWALAHLRFPKQLDWGNALATLDDFNRFLMLIFSKLLLFFYLGTALICFIYARELPDTDIGLAVLIFLSLYWLVRAILQVQHFGFRKADMMNVKMSSSNVSNQIISYILFIIFLIGCGLYLAPVLLTKL